MLKGLLFCSNHKHQYKVQGWFMKLLIEYRDKCKYVARIVPEPFIDAYDYYNIINF